MKVASTVLKGRIGKRFPVRPRPPLTNDCRLNLASEAIAKEKTIDTVGKQIQETRLRLEKSKRRCSIKNQLILKASF